MDKLKPILTHRFWILAGMALLLPVIGWWSSTSAMVEDFKKRSEDLNKAFTNAKLQPGPNQKWIEPIKQLNGEETHKVEDTRTLLWDHQQPLMAQWPENVVNDMRKLEPNAEIPAETRNLYRAEYKLEIARLWRIPKPYDEEDKTGRVIFPFEVLPRETWDLQPFPPNTKVMRDSQEDIWLLQALLEAIDAVNEDNGAPNLMDSAIREIRVIELHGGSKDKPKTMAATAGPGAAGAKSAGPGMPMPKSPGTGPSAASYMTGMNSGPGGAGGTAAADSASFAPQEVFGPEEDTKAAAGPATSGGARPPGPAGPASSPAGGGHGGGGAAQMPAGSSVMGNRSDVPKKRYIEENDQYRTRGFYIEVVMDQMQVPNLITKLSNTPWNSRILRVQEVDNDRSDVPNAGAPNRSGAQGMGGMSVTGPMPSGGSRPRPPRMASGSTMGNYGAAMRTPGGEAGGAAGGNEVASAMSDPALVHVAVAGVFTLYLPPPPPPPAPPGSVQPATTPTTPVAGATSATEEPAEGATEATEEEPAAEMPAEEGEPEMTDEAEMEKPEEDADAAPDTEKTPAIKPKPVPKPAADDET